MSTQPTPDELEALARKHGATSYRNRADTQHPAYGFTEDGLRNLLADAIARWGTPATGGEPVAWLDPWTGTKVTTDYDAYGKHGIPLYTSPQPVQSPIAWRYRMAGDLQWQYTERKEQFSHASEVEGLTNTQPVREPLSDEMVTAGARVLNQRLADECNINKDDQWAIYADDFKEEARAVLLAAHGITGGQHGTER